MRNLFALMTAFITLPAFAHPGNSTESIGFGFAQGFIHPLGGLDHLLAMVAVGLWSATTARRVWLAPLSFAGLLLIGTLPAIGAIALPLVESMITASVLLLGFLVMARVHLPELACAVLVGSFALFHGAAHGTELGTGIALAGMALATALLHGLGIGGGLLLMKFNLWWQRAVGGCIAFAGAGLAFNLA